MQTIAEQMKKRQTANSMRMIAERELNRLEQKLDYALNFSPHKVEYWRELIRQHKSAFSRYLIN